MDKMKTTIRTLIIFKLCSPPSPFASKSGGHNPHVSVAHVHDVTTSGPMNMCPESRN